MDLNDPETWRWFWLVAALAFGVGEISSGSFFLLPFAIGAAIASVLAFLGVSVGIEWLVFVISSTVLFVAFRPIARRLDSDGPTLGIGAHRQVSQRGRVVEAIEGEHDHGFVMLGPERWRAESANGEVIPVGATVVVQDVKGTRLVVVPADDVPGGSLPPTPPIEPPTAAP